MAMKICELRSYGPDDAILDRIDFMTKAFDNGADLRFHAPPAPYAETRSGLGDDERGSEIRDMALANGEVHLTPKFRICEIPAPEGDDNWVRAERLRRRIESMFDAARLYQVEDENAGAKLLLLDDHAGETWESRILDGTIALLDTPESTAIANGKAHFSVDMVRAPIRYTAEWERLLNGFDNAGFIVESGAFNLADLWQEEDPGGMVATQQNWTYWLTGGVSQRVVITAVAGNAGISYNGFRGNGLTDVTAGVEHYLSFNVYNAGAEDVLIRVYNGVGFEGPTLTFAPSEDFEEQELIWIPSGAAMFPWIYIPNPGGTTTFYVDKVYSTAVANLQKGRRSRRGWISGKTFQFHNDRDTGLTHGEPIGQDNDKVHINAVDIEDTDGDVVITPRLWMGVDSDNYFMPEQAVTIGSRFHDPWNFDWWTEIDNLALNTDCSNERYLLTAVPATTWTEVAEWLEAPVGNYGSYLVFARIAMVGVTGLDYKVRLEYGLDRAGAARSSVIQTWPINQTDATLANSWAFVFCGVANFPRPDFRNPAGAERMADFRIAVQLWDAVGHSFHVDFMCLVPLDGGAVRLLSKFDDVDLFLFDEYGRPWGYEGPAPNLWGLQLSYRGRTPRWSHSGPTRMIFMTTGTQDIEASVFQPFDVWADWRPHFR